MLKILDHYWVFLFHQFGLRFLMGLDNISIELGIRQYAPDGLGILGPDKSLGLPGVLRVDKPNLYPGICIFSIAIEIIQINGEKYFHGFSSFLGSVFNM